MSQTQIAVCTTTFDKYKPGKQKFFLQALVPMGSKNNDFTSSSASTSNILNKDIGALNIKPCQSGSIIELEVPKDICRWFDVKFIPEGTRFVVEFDHGDITRPRIIARDYFEEQGGYNGDDNEESGKEGRLF